MQQRPIEGMRLGLAEEAMLESSGVLVGPVVGEQSFGLSAETAELFTRIAAAGDGGLTRSNIPKRIEANLNEYLLPLEMQQLVTWERDKRGRLAYLVLTWKGQEVLDAARPRRGAKSMAARRRASVSD